MQLGNLYLAQSTKLCYKMIVNTSRLKVTYMYTCMHAFPHLYLQYGIKKVYGIRMNMQTCKNSQLMFDVPATS